MDQLLAAMSSYFHTRNSSISAMHPEAACHRQPVAVISNPLIHNYAVMMPSVQSFMKDCHTEKNSADICAVIRHHILDQVTRAGPLVTARLTAIKDVPMSNRVRSNPSYSVRGTKYVLTSSI